MQTIHIRQRFQAPPAKVFETLTDHVGMSDWAGVKVTLEREGNPPPNGLGAVRKIHVPGSALLEEVVHWDAPKQMNYKIIKGLPRNHLGEMRFEATDDGGTLLDYQIRFEIPWWATGPLLGTLIARQLKGAMEAGLRKLGSGTLGTRGTKSATSFL